MLKRLWRTLEVRRIKAKLGLFKNNDVERHILESILDSFKTPSDADLHWINKIENRRRELEKSKLEVEITDFGAGTTDALFQEGESITGVQRTTIIGEVCQKAAIAPAWAYLLYSLVKRARPAYCLELGTNLGVSAMYQLAALQRHNGHLATFEGVESYAGIAENNFRDLQLGGFTITVGRFGDTLPSFLQEQNPAIDFAFIDGHHDEHATKEYYQLLQPYLNDRAIVIFDDINWSDGMRKAWDYLIRDENSGSSFDLSKLGIITYYKQRAGRKQMFRFKI
ncbi:putative O-methyltransferase YrrM [Anseongella ginsenosidimutans]|uniref:Putative O-methyltransferase YrrM n=1 Tax=Anseongella ginsenosidimutans TaxID=496056 RepID=A0A4R3KLB8_9SPHI|nr:class I SAM-dependent methyltransferase [Anseongella ginsenosidimutans]QEC52123.1 class I SAM-dependent methyltransferase [Anseongella ginsenosidimutans]TCS84848.1 putative O-methyltransferase YrrM [Anseongella ginsenosidimutans]